MLNNTNTIVTINDMPIGFVQSVFIEDVKTEKEYYTLIKLKRFVDDTLIEDPVDKHRTGSFTIKFINNKTACGYVSYDAEVLSFTLQLDASEELALLTQEVVVKAKRFVYTSNTNEAGLTEEEIDWLGRMTKKQDKKKRKKQK